MFHHKLENECVGWGTWSPSGKYLFISRKFSEELANIEIWKCGEQGIPIDSEPLILENPFESSCSCDDLRTAKRQSTARDCEQTDSRDSFISAASSESEILEVAAAETERIWLCCSSFSKKTSAVGLLGLKLSGNSRGETVLQIERSHLISSESTFSCQCLSPPRWFFHSKDDLYSSIPCITPDGSFLARFCSLYCFRVRNGAFHTVTSLYDLESGEQPEIRGSIDCEQHFNNEDLVGKSISISPDSKYIALIRTATCSFESVTQTDFMVYKLTEGENSRITARPLLKKNSIIKFSFSRNLQERCTALFGYLFRMNNKLVLFYIVDSDCHCLCPETGADIFVIEGTSNMEISLNRSEDVLAISTHFFGSDEFARVFLLDLVRFNSKFDAFA